MRVFVQAAAVVACAIFATSAWGQATIDLTGVVLSSRNADCADYVGRYTSSITDARTGRKLQGAVEISATSDGCVIRTNQIPNHDTGEGFPHWRESIEENNLVVVISRRPIKAQQPSPLEMGANAVLLNGIKWEAYPAACFDVGREPLGREKIGCGPNELANP